MIPSRHDVHRPPHAPRVVAVVLAAGTTTASPAPAPPRARTRPPPPHLREPVGEAVARDHALEARRELLDDARVRHVLEQRAAVREVLLQLPPHLLRQPARLAVEAGSEEDRDGSSSGSKYNIAREPA